MRAARAEKCIESIRIDPSNEFAELHTDERLFSASSFSLLEQKRSKSGDKKQVVALLVGVNDQLKKFSCKTGRETGFVSATFKIQNELTIKEKKSLEMWAEKPIAGKSLDVHFF